MLTQRGNSLPSVIKITSCGRANAPPLQVLVESRLEMVLP